MIERHRSESLGNLSGRRADRALDSQQCCPIHHRTSEFDRGSIEILLVAIGNIFNPDVSLFCPRGKNADAAGQLSNTDSASDTPRALQKVAPCNFIHKLTPANVLDSSPAKLRIRLSHSDV